MSVLNKMVTYFPGITSTNNGVDVNLLSLLNSDKHQERIIRLRQSDPEEQKLLKEQLPCYTVAGAFRQRCDSGLLQPSGLAAVDLDSAEDYDIMHLLNELKKIDCIAYAGLSCRGQRLFCIVPFKDPEKYAKHYERLIQSFNDLGLPMGDNCHKRISQPRFVSWNDGTKHFFNHDARVYDLLPSEKRHYYVPRKSSNIHSAPDNPFEWCMEQVSKSHDFIEGARHEFIIQLTRYCNIKGLSIEETLSGCGSLAQPSFPVEEIEGIVQHIYQNQSDSHNRLPFKRVSSKKSASTSDSLWDREDFLALDEMMEMIKERGIKLPKEIRGSWEVVKSLRNRQNQRFKQHLNKLVRFISCN